MINEFELKFKAVLANELLARNAVMSFLSPLNPSYETLCEFKTIISEGVSNAIIHGYKFDNSKDVYLKVVVYENDVEISIRDFGVGIDDVNEARMPHYTSRPDLERAGMGLTIIESLSDSLRISSIPGTGVKLIIRKKLLTQYINE